MNRRLFNHLFIITFVLCVSQMQYSYVFATQVGDPCRTAGIPGTCQEIGNCPDSLHDYPVACALSGPEVLICCSRKTTTTTTPTTRSSSATKQTYYYSIILLLFTFAIVR